MGQRASTEPQDDGELAWWFKYLAKGVGTIAGLVAMGLGIFACISISGTCILAGVLQFCLGLLVLVFEAPCCCQCLDFIEKIAEFSDNRKHWQKAVAYCIPPIAPICLCAGISTIFGCGVLFVTGSIYGLMALGKKADRDVMKARAVVGNGDDVEMQVTLVNNEEKDTPPAYTSLPTYSGNP